MIMVITLLMRLIYMLRNHINQNVKIKRENNVLTNVRDLSNNMQMLIKILKITTQCIDGIWWYDCCYAYWINY